MIPTLAAVIARPTAVPIINCVMVCGMTRLHVLMVAGYTRRVIRDVMAVTKSRVS
jgi:hypothetical protein